MAAALFDSHRRLGRRRDRRSRIRFVRAHARSAFATRLHRLRERGRRRRGDVHLCERCRRARRHHAARRAHGSGSAHKDPYSVGNVDRGKRRHPNARSGRRFGPRAVPLLVGVPTLSFGFAGPFGVYHSVFDDLRYATTEADPGFNAHRTMAQMLALTAYRLTLGPMPLSPVRLHARHARHAQPDRTDHGARAGSRAGLPRDRALRRPRDCVRAGRRRSNG